MDQNVGNNPTTDTVNWKLAGSGPVAIDTTYAGEVGPILTDEVDGHTYRLISTSGVITTEQVT